MLVVIKSINVCSGNDRPIGISVEKIYTAVAKKGIAQYCESRCVIKFWFISAEH